MKSTALRKAKQRAKAAQRACRAAEKERRAAWRAAHDLREQVDPWCAVRKGRWTHNAPRSARLCRICKVMVSLAPKKGVRAGWNCAFCHGVFCSKHARQHFKDEAIVLVSSSLEDRP